LNILFVDDEALARHHIKSMLPCEGFCLVGEASNGYAALEFLNGHSAVDIIITDMSMPLLDGIGLIESVLQVYPLIKVIALSGFSDFQYIRQSMKNGAVDYLLKHELTEDTLLAALRTASDHIRRDRDASMEKQVVHTQLLQGRKVLQQQAIGQILKGSIPDSTSILEMIRSLAIPIPERHFILIAAEIDDIGLLEEKFNEAEMVKLHDAFLGLCQEAGKSREGASAFGLETGRAVLFIPFGDSNSQLYMHTVTSQLIGEIRSGSRKLLNLTASYAVSEWITHVSDIVRVFEKTLEVLRGRFYKGKDLVFFGSGWRTTTKTSSTIAGIDIKTEKELASAILSLNIQETEQILSRVFNQFLTAYPPVQTVRMTAIELIHLIQKLARENGVPSGRLFDTEIPYERLQKLETIHDMKTWIQNAIRSLIVFLTETRSGSQLSEYGRKAMEFILQHYRKDISLQMAAEEIGITASYLSRMFKQDFGVGFSEYLNEYRVKQTKILIESGLYSLKQITEMTGFHNYNYFFRVFKGLAGMTPVQYEKAFRKNS
jgi:two-component system, response regulator YesN